MTERLDNLINAQNIIAKPENEFSDEEITCSKEKLNELIEKKEINYIVDNPNEFPGLSCKEVVLDLIKAGYDDFVVDNLEKFQGLDRKETILGLIKAGRSSHIINNLEKLQGLDYKEIALESIRAGGGGHVIINLEKFQSSDYKEIALELIKVGHGNYVVDSLEKFKIIPQDFYQAAKEKFLEYISEVETKFPKLAEQLSKSPELIINILALRYDFPKLEKSINKAPFLLEALEENPRYGSKLILKYREFDKNAKGNIKELFSIKEDILKENPGVNTDSAEFRKLAQEKLSSYKNNPEVLKELENRGVNVDNWLNYDEPIYFTLGEQEDVKFSNKIKMPITRIRETLNKYKESLASTLSEYKKELQETFIPSQESEELKQKIKDQENSIALATDEKKTEGIKKGLAILKTKEESLKSVSIWSRVQSDIFRLKSMIENIFKFHDSCVANEMDLETIKDRKELIKEKDKLEKNKIQLKENLKEFELFFESYETKLQELIAPSLGQERSDSLIQEMKEKIGEELNHYDTDKNTLNNIFDSESKDGNALNGREMKITISSRSPEDLYLGNYCPCCICIDSEYHDAESPIADYVTDLGIQNIVVYDEKKNVPVVVCWTFIGENSADGKPILVIDNIEANTEYTNGYPDKLKEIITEFAENYAKSVNITQIVQGAHNNDLEVFPFGEEYKKLGRIYNRSDGYFLEEEHKEDDGEDNEDEDLQMRI